MSHTEGKLNINEFDEIFIGTEMLMVRGVSLPMTPGARMDEAKANAHRLVACWNACDGLPTDLLEHMVNPTSTYTALLKERNDLVKERDELVGILRRTVKYANRKPFNLTKEIDVVLTKYPEAS